MLHGVLISVCFLWMPVMTAAQEHSNVCKDEYPLIEAIKTFDRHGKEAAGKVFNLYPDSCEREAKIEITEEMVETFVEVVQRGSVSYGYVVMDRQDGRVFIAHAMIGGEGARDA